MTLLMPLFFDPLRPFLVGAASGFSALLAQLTRRQESDPLPPKLMDALWHLVCGCRLNLSTLPDQLMRRPESDPA
jgi:hypothetical protein